MMQLKSIPGWMYHPIDAPQGQLFTADPGELPVGWVDTPARFDKALEAIKAAGLPVKAPAPGKPVGPVTQPLPENFEDIDAFMAAFVAANEVPESGRQRDSALKVGVEQYLKARHNTTVDRRMSLENMREEAVRLDQKEVG